MYIFGYVAAEAAMVTTAVVALGSRKLTERGGRQLTLLSGIVMSALGIVPLARQDWLL